MFKPLIAAAFAALLSVVVVGSAHAQASAEPLDIDPAILSKLAKERAKTNTVAKRSATANKSANGPDQNDADCGAVAIGNVTTGSRIGFQPQEVTVIVTGDVINANNRCR
jgi:uncharacterized low-complexity protein